MKVTGKRWWAAAVFLFGALATNLTAQAQTTNTFPASGNVGIGTTSPQGLLDVNGIVGAQGFKVGSTFADRINNAPSYGIGYSNLLLPGTEANGGNAVQLAGFWGLYFRTANGQIVLNEPGNVGIGTTTPNGLLDLFKTQSGETDLYIDNRNTTAANTQTGIVFTGFRDVSNPWPLAKIQVQSQTSGAGELAQNGEMRFYTGGYDFGGLAQRMVIQSGGNIGIGTTVPGYKLDIAGQIHTAGGVVYPDGTLQSTAWTGSLCGGDYAESIDVSDNRKQYEPGDVLVIDPHIEGKFLKSTEPYSKTVAGVYSTKPGVVGRRQTTPKSPNEILMAVIGIVPVKVSAENGSIQPGDMLVTSSTPGYAMKGTDYSRMFGAVIGKAMGSLGSGSGAMEVLVTLQ